MLNKNILIIVTAFLFQHNANAAVPGNKSLLLHSLKPKVTNLKPDFENLDTTSVDSTTKSTTLEFGAAYNSNNNLGGQFSNVELQPAWSAIASLNMKSGFDVSLNYLFIQNSDSTYSKSTSNANLEFGYAFDFLKYFNLHLSVNHTFQPKNTSSLKKGYDNSLAADLSYDFEWIFGSISSTYMLGNKVANKTAKLNSLSFIIADNLSFEIEDFPGDNNNLTFQPGIIAGISDQRLYNNYLLTALTDNPKPLIAKLLKKRPNLTVAEAIKVLKAKTMTGQKFQANSFGLNMPVVAVLGDYTITLTPSAYKPLNQPSFIDSSWKFTFELGVSYTFSL